MDTKIPKKIEYKIGLFLIFFYILTSYVAVDILVPSKVNTLFLYAFLGWGAFVTLIYGIKEKLSIYTIWYGLFMSFSLLFMINSPAFEILSGEFYLMIVAFLLTFFIQTFIRSEKELLKVCWFYGIGSFALVMMLLFTGNLVGGSDADRLGQELMGNANTFAFMIMFAVFLELFLLIYISESKYQRILLIFMVLFNMYALALSAGRKFFILPFVFAYLLLILKINKRGKRNFILYTVLSIIVVITVFNMIMKGGKFLLFCFRHIIHWR